MRIALLILLSFIRILAAEPQPSTATDPIAKPAWATEIGRDQYGIWSDLEVGGAIQRMRLILAGTFTMGSPSSEAGRSYDEAQHSITLTHDFWLGESVCTQIMWKVLMGNSPSHFMGDPELPVECVSWVDCQMFLIEMNRIVPGCHARLPTEAEWEYACRAGNSGPYAGMSVDALAWNKSNSSGRTHPVMTKAPNPWGLYDMHGNVYQWCFDWDDGYDIWGKEFIPAFIDPKGPAFGWTNSFITLSPSKKIFRGGCYCSWPNRGRSAERNYQMPDTCGNSIGFRICISAQLTSIP
jgi:sulfatase modifying factor 1